MTKLFLLFFILSGIFFSCESSPQEEKIIEKAVLVDLDTMISTETIDTSKTYIDTIKYTKTAAGFIQLNWKHLAEVDFEERYSEEVQNYIPYPNFRPSVQRLSGQKVQIKGYIIPVEETGEESIIVLSANPFSACFFCGMAGPETIMDIKLKAKIKNSKRFKQDDILTFRGKMRLNETDLYYLNYILEDAELVE